MTNKTSAVAAQRAKDNGTAAEKRAIILEALNAAPEGLTAREMLGAIRMHHPACELNSVSNRPAELVAKGKIHIAGSRECSITGENVSVWKFGPHSEFKPARKKSNTKVIAALRSAVNQLRECLIPLQDKAESFPGLEDHAVVDVRIGTCRKAAEVLKTTENI